MDDAELIALLRLLKTPLGRAAAARIEALTAEVERLPKTYRELKKWVEDQTCQECRGLGECNDASPFDISFNTWKCTKCGGSGLVESAALQPQEKVG